MHRNPRINNQHDSDEDDAIYTTTQQQQQQQQRSSHGPLHLPNNQCNNHLASLPLTTNARPNDKITNSKLKVTATGETTKERSSKITSTTAATHVIGPAAVLANTNSINNNNNRNNNNRNNIKDNEYDGTLTYHDDVDDEDYGHGSNGYIHHPVHDDHDEQDVVSILSDDKLFDTPVLFSVCGCCCRVRKSRALLCLQVLLGCSILTLILVVAGVCRSGHCRTNKSNTSLGFNNNNTGKLCNRTNLSSSVPSPTSCQPPQQPIPLPPISTTNNNPTTTDGNTIYKAFTSTQELYDAVDEYLATGISDPTYGPTIGSWNISLLTDLSNVFNANDRNPSAMYFNEDLSGWDTSRVTTMENLFLDARTFNGDVSTWQTGNVQNMHETFGRAVSFNGDVSNWDVSKVTTIARLCEFYLFELWL
jgi:surface protein